MQGDLSIPSDRRESFHPDPAARVGELRCTVAHLKMVPLQRQVAVLGDNGDAQFVGRMVNVTPDELAILEGEKTIAFRKVELQRSGCGNRVLRHCTPLVAGDLALVFAATTQRKTRAEGDPRMLVSQPESTPGDPHCQRSVAIEREKPDAWLTGS